MSDSSHNIGGRWWIAIFVLALLVRVVCVAQYERSHPLADRPGIDEESYDEWAREIASGELVGREIFFQEPLYPYLLGATYALAGDDPSTQRSAARYTQCCIGALTACFAAAAGARLFGSAAGRIAGLAFALHRPAIWFPSLLLKENLFTAMLVLFAWWLVLTREGDADGTPRVRAWSRWFVLGLLGACGALLRGNMLVLLPIFAVWPFARALRQRRGFGRASVASAMFVVGVLVVLTPVVWRNHHVGGRLVLTTSGAGTNVYGGNNLDNPYGVATEFDFVRGIPEHEAGDWRREASRRAGRELDATETSSFWLRTTLTSVREHPLEHARILGRKLRLTLGSYEVPDNHFLEWDARHVGVLAWPWPGFALFGTAGLAGVLVFLARRGRGLERELDVGAACEFLAVGVLYLGTVVLTVTSERIRLPLVPLLLPFAGYLWIEVVEGVRRWWTAIPAIALAAWFVLSPVLPADKRGADFDERDFNLAVSLLEAGDLRAAAPIIDGLIERRPHTPRVQVVAAELEYRIARAELDAAPRARRMPEQPAKHIESALRRLEGAARRGSPQESFRAHVLDGAIRQYLGQWNEAEEHYRAARAFDPDDRDLRRRLAVVLAERAVQTQDPTARAARFAEATQLLEHLIADQADPELTSLLRQIAGRD